jgi:hypothetical protein
MIFNQCALFAPAVKLAVEDLLQRDRLVGREPFEPFFVIRVQARFIVVDKHGSRDVHGVDQHQTFLDTAFPEAVFHLPRDVDERSSAGNLKTQLFAKGLHPSIVALVRAVHGGRCQSAQGFVWLTRELRARYGARRP